MNNNNENTYGQSVRLNYNATLNDNASTRTGRAGFENAVRLEYSNNPDSDGNLQEQLLGIQQFASLIRSMV